MGHIFVGEVKVHNNPPERKTFIAYAENKDELKALRSNSSSTGVPDEIQY